MNIMKIKLEKNKAIESFKNKTYLLNAGDGQIPIKHFSYVIIKTNHTIINKKEILDFTFFDENDDELYTDIGTTFGDYQNSRVWLLSIYKEINEDLKNPKYLQIDTVMMAIKDILIEIKTKDMFDKRINISKNISVLLYINGNYEIHVSDNSISTYELFKMDKYKKAKELENSIIHTRWKDKNHLENHLNTFLMNNAELSDIDESGLVADNAFIYPLYEEEGYLEIYFLDIPLGEDSIFITEINISKD